MRYKRQTLYTLASTLILMTYCAKAVPKKKRVVIHVPETVKHIHHHHTKKVPMPIVVFTKNPKEPKEHKEYKDYSEHKDYYSSMTEEHPQYTSGGYEGDYVESNTIVRGVKHDVGAYDAQMARGVVADFHQVKPKIISEKDLPRHLTPPYRTRNKSMDTGGDWSNDDEEEDDRDQFNYGTWKIYKPPNEKPRIPYSYRQSEPHHGQYRQHHNYGHPISSHNYEQSESPQGYGYSTPPENYSPYGSSQNYGHSGAPQIYGHPVPHHNHVQSTPPLNYGQFGLPQNHGQSTSPQNYGQTTPSQHYGQFGSLHNHIQSTPPQSYSQSVPHGHQYFNIGPPQESQQSSWKPTYPDVSHHRVRQNPNEQVVDIYPTEIQKPKKKKKKKKVVKTSHMLDYSPRPTERSIRQRSSLQPQLDSRTKYIEDDYRKRRRNFTTKETEEFS